MQHAQALQRCHLVRAIAVGPGDFQTEPIPVHRRLGIRQGIRGQRQVQIGMGHPGHGADGVCQRAHAFGPVGGLAPSAQGSGQDGQVVQRAELQALRAKRLATRQHRHQGRPRLVEATALSRHHRRHRQQLGFGLGSSILGLDLASPLHRDHKLIASGWIVLSCEVQVGEIAPRQRRPLRSAATLGQLGGLLRQAR